jgi:hypothetical protein
MSTAFSHAQYLKKCCLDILSVFHDAGAAFTAARIKPSTFDSVTELCALQLHSQFETFIEVERLVSPETRDHAYSLLTRTATRETEYLTWLPPSVIFARAEKFFRFGRPFSRLAYRPQAVRGLQQLTIVRNAVAHPSQTAQRKFEQMSKDQGYRVVRAADFLLSQRDGNTELEHLIALVRAIGNALAEPAEQDAETFLGPERRFQSGETSVPPGIYSCDKCAIIKSSTVAFNLDLCACTSIPTGACPSCGQVAPCSVCSKPRRPQSTHRRDLV